MAARDGNALAVLTLGNGYVVRAAATGTRAGAAPVTALPPSARPANSPTATSPLWSPNGNWLLLPTLALVHVGALKV